MKSTLFLKLRETGPWSEGRLFLHATTYQNLPTSWVFLNFPLVGTRRRQRRPRHPPKRESMRSHVPPIFPVESFFVVPRFLVASCPCHRLFQICVQVSSSTSNSKPFYSNAYVDASAFNCCQLVVKLTHHVSVSLLNGAGGLYGRILTSSCVQTSLPSVWTHERGQDSPI